MYDITDSASLSTELVELKTKYAALARRVRDLHQRVDSGIGMPGWDTCSHCHWADGEDAAWPCETILALDEVEHGKESSLNTGEYRGV